LVQVIVQKDRILDYFRVVNDTYLLRRAVYSVFMSFDE
jgi:hypothetical protein